MLGKVIRTKYSKIALMTIIIVLVAMIFILGYLRTWTADNPEMVQRTIQYVDAYGVLGMFFFALVAGTIIPFPIEPVLGGVVVLGSSKVYALILATALGHLVGTLASFYLARYLREPYVYKKIDKKSIKTFNSFWAKSGDWILFVALLVPVIGDIVAFLAGLSKMSVKRFIPIVAAAKLINYTVYALLAFKIAETWFSFIL